MFQISTQRKRRLAGQAQDLPAHLGRCMLLAGLASAVARQADAGRHRARSTSASTSRAARSSPCDFKQRPSAEDIRDALAAKPASPDAHRCQSAPTKPRRGAHQTRPQADGLEEEQAAGAGRRSTSAASKVAEALKTLSTARRSAPTQGFPAEGNAFQIIGTDAVGAVAGAALRNQAVTVTLLALVGILLYIAFRFEWTYGAAAVITVFHDVLVTLGFFSIFQWEVNLTVIAALLTLVGFSVNDTIVTFDRIRENLRLHRRANALRPDERGHQPDALAHGHHVGARLPLGAGARPLRRRGAARLLARALHRHHLRHLLDHRHRQPDHGLVAAAAGGRARLGTAGRHPRWGRRTPAPRGRHARRQGQRGRALRVFARVRPAAPRRFAPRA